VQDSVVGLFGYRYELFAIYCSLQLCQCSFDTYSLIRRLLASSDHNFDPSLSFGKQPVQGAKQQQSKPLDVETTRFLKPWIKRLTKEAEFEALLEGSDDLFKLLQKNAWKVPISST